MNKNDFTVLVNSDHIVRECSVKAVVCIFVCVAASADGLPIHPAGHRPGHPAPDGRGLPCHVLPQTLPTEVQRP